MPSSTNLPFILLWNTNAVFHSHAELGFESVSQFCLNLSLTWSVIYFSSLGGDVSMGTISLSFQLGGKQFHEGSDECQWALSFCQGDTTEAESKVLLGSSVMQVSAPANSHVQKSWPHHVLLPPNLRDMRNPEKLVQSPDFQISTKNSNFLLTRKKFTYNIFWSYSTSSLYILTFKFLNSKFINKVGKPRVAK